MPVFHDQSATFDEGALAASSIARRWGGRRCWCAPPPHGRLRQRGVVLTRSKAVQRWSVDAEGRKRWGVRLITSTRSTWCGVLPFWACPFHRTRGGTCARPPSRRLAGWTNCASVQGHRGFTPQAQRMSSRCRMRMPSPEYALEHPVFVHVHVRSGRPLWQARHGHHVAKNRHDEASPCVQSEFCNGEGEAGRSPEASGVVAEMYGSWPCTPGGP
ncbi:MAG: hypothetical protein CM15mP79_2330 [Methanobacteriota archaeon]|nr:MAG: hypothetical protein CM15mP79_2330 [Euryarchaeota archaeon]